MFVKNILLQTRGNHRLESAGLNALEQLLFFLKILGMEKMVKRDRKLALLSIS